LCMQCKQPHRPYDPINEYSSPTHAMQVIPSFSCSTQHVKPKVELEICNRTHKTCYSDFSIHFSLSVSFPDFRLVCKCLMGDSKCQLWLERTPYRADACIRFRCSAQRIGRRCDRPGGSLHSRFCLCHVANIVKHCIRARVPTFLLPVHISACRQALSTRYHIGRELLGPGGPLGQPRGE
jgi:hypothetical protein